MSSPNHLVKGVCLLGLVAAVSPVQGQTFLPDPVDEVTFTIQWEKPLLANASGVAFYSSILEPDLLLPAGPGKTVQIGIPLAVAGGDAVDGTSLALANARVSVLFGDPDDLRGFVGVTLPTVSNVSGPGYVAQVVGSLPWLSVPEKWMEDAFSARGAWIPSKRLENGGQIGLRVGATALMPTGLENLWVLTRLAGWGRFALGSAELRADLDTSYHLTGDDGFGQQFTSYLALGIGFKESATKPTIFLRLPLDGDARRWLDYSIGVSMVF